MPRNDGLLSAGLSNASSRLKLLREDKANKKQQDRARLAPAADLVFAELKKDQAMLGELLLGIVDPESTDDQVRVKLEAVRLHRVWLVSFENRMKKILRLSDSEKKANERASKEASNG